MFSDPEIARYMNEHFVNIKVDREERPDLDDIYMTALQQYYVAIGSPQSGGWPLSMFPDARRPADRRRDVLSPRGRQWQARVSQR